jgi:hypothetical protein
MECNTAGWFQYWMNQIRDPQGRISYIETGISHREKTAMHSIMKTFHFEEFHFVSQKNIFKYMKNKNLNLLLCLI